MSKEFIGLYENLLAYEKKIFLKGGGGGGTI